MDSMASASLSLAFSTCVPPKFPAFSVQAWSNAWHSALRVSGPNDALSINRRAFYPAPLSRDRNAIATWGDNSMPVGNDHYLRASKVSTGLGLGEHSVRALHEALAIIGECEPCHR